MGDDSKTSSPGLFQLVDCKGMILTFIFSWQVFGSTQDFYTIPYTNKTKLYTSYKLDVPISLYITYNVQVIF